MPQYLPACNTGSGGLGTRRRAGSCGRGVDARDAGRKDAPKSREAVPGGELGGGPRGLRPGTGPSERMAEPAGSTSGRRGGGVFAETQIVGRCDFASQGVHSQNEGLVRRGGWRAVPGRSVHDHPTPWDQARHGLPSRRTHAGSLRLVMAQGPARGRSPLRAGT